MVEITNPKTNEVWNFYVEEKLKPLIKKIQKNLSMEDRDYVMIVDGYEGSGKSTFAQQIGRAVDPILEMDRICMTANEFKDAITNSKKNQCVIYDEAVTGLSSGASISKVGKLLRSMMMQMRQKNLFVIIILPTIFELNKYSVLYRARSLFHIYEKNGKRGYWVGYNRKDIKKLYLKGKRSYSYLVRSMYNGRFYGKYTVNEEEYRKKKEEALFKLEDDDEIKENTKRRVIIGLDKDGNPVKEIYEMLKRWQIALSESQIYRILKKYREK